MKQFRQFVIQRRHHLVLHFNYTYADASLLQIFSHFQADKTATYDCCRFGLSLLHYPLYPIRIRHRPKCMNSLAVNPRDRRNHGGRACCDHKVIVRFLICLPRHFIKNGQFLILSVYCGHFT